MNKESWYTCINCNQEYQFYEMIITKSGDAECSICEGHTFIKSQHSEAYDGNNYYDYADYDIYDQLY